MIVKVEKTLTNPTNMQYHHNAKTNIAQRQMIKEAKSTPNRTLAKQYRVSIPQLANGRIQIKLKTIPAVL
jgi:hypothetical protein